MNSKIKRILSILLIASIFTSTISTNSYASNVELNEEKNDIVNETNNSDNKNLLNNNETKNISELETTKEKEEQSNSIETQTDTFIKNEYDNGNTNSQEIQEDKNSDEKSKEDINNEKNVIITDNDNNQIDYTLKDIENQDELIEKIDFSKISGNLVWFKDISVSESGNKKVSISINDINDRIPYVVHFKNGTEPEYVDATIENDTVNFELDSFSPIAIYVSNNVFHYTIGDEESFLEWKDLYMPNGIDDLYSYDENWYNSLFDYEKDLVDMLKSLIVDLPDNVWDGQSLDECISIIENGTNADVFFAGTIYAGLQLDDLYKLKQYNYTLENVADFINGLNGDNNEYFTTYLDKLENDEDVSIYENLIDILGKLTFSFVSTYDSNSGSLVGVMKVTPTKWKGINHGTMYKLQVNDTVGLCGGYGKHARNGYLYKAGKGDFVEAYGPIGYICKYANWGGVNWVGAQLALWLMQQSRNYDAFTVKTYAMAMVARSDELYKTEINDIANYAWMIYSSAKKNPCKYYIYVSTNPSAQPYYTNAEITGTSQPVIPPPDPDSESIEIPTIDNYYIEKKAQTKYNVEVTKESIITNELLEGIKFKVVESKASGKSLDYDIVRGTLAQDNQTYLNATTSSFGQTTRVNDPVPYMDDDVQPSGGNHETTITTDKNGYAKTTFIHEHTFKEFYSICKDGSGNEIPYDSYTSLLDNAISVANKMDDDDELEVTYQGSTSTMSPDEVIAICNAQKIVYTQTQDEAENTIEDRYDKYCARTYTYTVTELDNYTRNASTDSNNKLLNEITLPKAGYRKDVKDATTINTYSKVVKDGGTMTTGGTNDSDNNTREKNVTNEPWYNQLFINKTDLESNNQILYDTKFEIYEYYNSKTTLTGAPRTVYSQNVLKEALGQYNSQVELDTITGAKLTVYGPNKKIVTEKNVNVVNNDSISFTPSKTGTYTVTLEITVDDESSFESTSTKTISGVTFEEIGNCICDDVCLEDECEVCKVNNALCKTKQFDENCICTDTCDPESCKVCELDNSLCKTKIKEYTVNKMYKDEFTYINAVDQGNGTFVSEDDTIFNYTLDEETGIYTIHVKNPDGSENTYRTDDDGIAFIVLDDNGSKEINFGYFKKIDSGIKVFSYTDENGDIHYSGKDENHTYVKIDFDEDSKVATLYYYPSEKYKLNDGYYKFDTTITITSNDLTNRKVETNINTNINDYTTWGQDNYEIVRVTPEIAKQMGWDDTTIGMYTVHRLSDFDSYTGTTFTSAKDESTGKAFGYYEYGTLYYTQSNLGKYAIVEEEAPADNNRTGYLGNYSDRDYTYLDEQSEQKNNNGDPYATDDQTSKNKMVHYINLCTDTNQYATYMLTDGFKEYDDTYYRNYQETIGDTATEDGYDADYYLQSGLNRIIGLERFVLNDPISDILNQAIDRYFIDYFKDKSGLTIRKDSQKTDTYFALDEITDKLLNFVGTTINNDSFDSNESKESEITYNGTYTDTNINYNSYTENAQFLNARHGFNNCDYLQVGIVNYDNGTKEKNARFYNTEEDVNKEQGYAFIDERTYGFIRLTKYDIEAERYIDGDLDENYVAGTDHADADLDGAIYSLYVSETNSFDVDYYEGGYKGQLIWAQQLRSGGYRVIYDGDSDMNNGFTDNGDNNYEDYPDAYVSDGKLYFYYDDTTYTEVEKKTITYYGIQHPDGQYGGAKHNGFFAVLEEQQVFIDADEDGYADTWTVQDVTLEDGAKVASATIKNGELTVDGLYLGKYTFVEEVRDSISIHSTNNDDEESSEIRWLSFAHGYLAETDRSGNPIKHNYTFPYKQEVINNTTYKAEQIYVQKDTEQYSNQEVVKGAGFQIKKTTSNGESSSSNNTNAEDLEGAGFTVYLISELSLIKDGTIKPAFSEEEGNYLVYNNDLVALYDNSDNLVGYQFTRNYIEENNPFTAKYGTDYKLDEVNQIVFVSGHGYYYVQDILDAYKEKYYSQDLAKWDFSQEENAIARIYENNENELNNINADYKYINNSLNNGSPCEYYGLNGIVKDNGDVWVPTNQRNEYKLAEIYTNHFGNLRSPELAWGAYIVIETSTPKDVFTTDPMFVTITDSSASANRTKTRPLGDVSFKASLILVKRDAQSGQNVVQKNISYRIWDYTNNRYVTKYLLGQNGELSLVAQSVFTTDDEGKLNAIASLELGKYRIEELTGPTGYHNTYWDHGNKTNGETLNGIGTDADRNTVDNMFKPYYGTVDFEITTDRLYKSSGIVDSDNLDYIYIGETYYNDETLGKVTIKKTGDVLVGYRNTDDIEYADEYTNNSDKDYKLQKARLKDRSVFENIKNYYDLGRDNTEYRIIEENLSDVTTTKVDYIAIDQNGMRIAPVYTDGDKKLTMNQGVVYTTGFYQENEEKVYYPASTLKDLGTYAYKDNDKFIYVTRKEEANGVNYYDENNNLITDTNIINNIKKMGELTTKNNDIITDAYDSFIEIKDEDQILMIEYDLSLDIYEKAELRPIDNTYIINVKGNTVNTSYLATKEDETYITNDNGVITKDGLDYKLTYKEAIYDPDIDYNYILTIDNETKDFKFVTYGIYMSKDGIIAKQLKDGGYEIIDGTTKISYPNATMTLKDENSGITYDFVYEERPLANATYQITAAEDIQTQDGNNNYWFKQGDVVATVTTGEDGEIVKYSPNYKTEKNAGAGTYDYTYYYGNTDGTYTSLTGTKSYNSDNFITSGSIKNYWTANSMSQLDQDLYGIPAYTDATIYPNTFYKEETLPIIRRIYKGTKTKETIASDYVTRLEKEGNITSESEGIVTETDDGYKLTYKDVKSYPNSTLVKEGDYYKLVLASGEKIEVKENQLKYIVTESTVTPWEVGDIVEKTSEGYHIEHTNECEKGISNGAKTDGAFDLGYTHAKNYDNASIKDNGDGTYTLFDKNNDEVVTMKPNPLMTSDNGYVEKTVNGYQITYVKSEDITSNNYVHANLRIDNATLTVKNETYNLYWDNANQTFKTTFGTTVTLNDDYSKVIVTTGETTNEYTAFDLVIDYSLHYASKENIVTIEKNGNLGEVSIYLPLGKYEIKEIETPYGFMSSNKVQTIDIQYQDQIKEIVFNTDKNSTKWTEDTLNIWKNKGLQWFIGGINTIGEKLLDIMNVNHWTWNTYGDAEVPNFKDKNSIITYYNERVKAWSQKETPDNPEQGETPEEERRKETEENQWKLGVGVYKTDKETKENLSGAKFGLYTTDNIYNADGKLLVPSNALLATATTDNTGFANFAVDIALMSRKNDENRKDTDLIYNKTVTYSYEKLEKLKDDEFNLIVSDTDIIKIYKSEDTYKTEDGIILHIDTIKKEVTYTIEQSIDGNTAMNTGKFYIKELTPPDGYLYDDTIYPVNFEYDNDKTMYIPVYAEHQNEKTEVTITKKDLTGSEEIPGAKISVYKINDITKTNDDGMISHDDDNLRLIDTWISTDEEHLVKGLLLSNNEWARLGNQEIRDNIYVFREEIPADGYASANDIEFKLYQKQKNGKWKDNKGNLYGYDVIVNHVTCDQDYISGTIVAPTANADDWIKRGETENTWNYTTTLEATTVAKWLLVNKNLVVFLSKDATPETIQKVLQEKDFEQYDFETVYFEFGGDKFDIDFFNDLVVTNRPDSSKITYTSTWCTLDDIDVFMYDDTTKVRISKQDIVTGEDVVGATLKITDKETGKIIDTWVTGEDDFNEDGNPNQHYIENKFIVGHTYILEETLAPTQDGYVKSNSVEFTVEDTGEIQDIVMEDDFTKLEISKTDITNGEEIEGATLEVWTTNKNGEKDTLVETWISGQDGKDKDGKFNKHYIDYLPIGDYILTEKITPFEQGFVTSNDIKFTITETGLLQQVNMVDDITKVDILKVDAKTKEPLKDANLELWSLNEDKTKNEKIKTWKTDGTAMHFDKLPIGFYAIVETAAPDEYEIAGEMIIEIKDTPDLQTFEFLNYKKQVIVRKHADKDTVKVGEKLTYTIYRMANYSSDSVDEFTCIDTLPTNVRMETLNTGTFNQDWNYTLWYKTNIQADWKQWGTEYNSQTTYTLNVSDLKLANGEYITEFKYYFDTVDGMFDVNIKPTYIVNVFGRSGEKIINNIVLTAQKNKVLYTDNHDSTTTIVTPPTPSHRHKHNHPEDETIPPVTVAEEVITPSIETGDTNQIEMYILLSALALTTLCIIKRKKNK